MPTLSKRALAALGATVALSLAVAGTASAKTVYNYAYSGSYIDGSTAGKQFDAQVGGLYFDGASDQLYVTNGSTGVVGGWVSKYNAATGASAKFSSIASPLLFIAGDNPQFPEASITIDQRPGPTKGNILVEGGNRSFKAFTPTGQAIPGFDESNEGSCGIAAPPSGEDILVPGRFGLFYYDMNGDLSHYEIPGSPGWQPGVKVRWEENGTACKAVFDSNGNLYGIQTPQVFGPPLAHVVKMDGNGLEQYEVSQGETSTGLAIDESDDDLFVLDGRSEEPTFELYDPEGRALGGGFGKAEPSNSYEGLRPFGFLYEGGPLVPPTGIAVDPATHDVWVTNGRDYGSGTRRVEKFVPIEPHVIPDTTAVEPAFVDPKAETVELKGILNPDGEETTDCHFELGTTQALGESFPCSQGDHFDGSDDVEVSAVVPVKKGSRYYYKLSSENGNGQPAPSNQVHFFPQAKPLVSFLGVDRINTDGVRLRADIDPNGGNATYHFEWGQDGNFEFSGPESPSFGFASEKGEVEGSDRYTPGVREEGVPITGLTPGSTYEYRLVVHNEAGTVTTEPKEFTTYVPDPGSDSCANAQVRQQTEASLLPDCRAYELVSARNTGGFDVESDIVPGQAPLEARPRAQDKLLYSLNSGILPGVEGSPTNHGLDPYVATRGDEGWTTRYVGIPSDGMVDQSAFGSPLLGTDAGLETFAFGGSGICAPCFSDGTSNVPLRRPDGSLEKGMAGSPDPSADPAGTVLEPLSEDGSHFVFGAEASFADGGPEGALGIYERNLRTDETEFVSGDDNGVPLAGPLAELAVSPDGSRVLIGRQTGDDAGGNPLYDLFLHTAGGGTQKVVESPSGVLFAGMTDDGSQVYFTTTDSLAGDTDTSADFYRAELGDSGDASLSLLSAGDEGTGNDDSCTPVDGWNVVSGAPDCSVLAFAGGAGVAAEDGTAYFMSPEQLDGSGNGEAGQVNVYSVAPGETAPHYVGLLDSSAFRPGPQPPNHPVVKSTVVGGLARAENMTTDTSNGDIYVIEGEGSDVARFTADGGPKPFGSIGSNEIGGFFFLGSGKGQVAFDNAAGSPFEGDLYVSNFFGISLYDGEGNLLGNPMEAFGEAACGIAVDQTNGDLYVGDAGEQTIWRLRPTGGATPVSEGGNYEKTGIKTTGLSPCNLTVDGSGNVYASGAEAGPVQRFHAADFEAAPPTVAGEGVTLVGRGMGIDPTTDELYVNEGTEIGRYSPSGDLIQKFGDIKSIGTQSRGLLVRPDGNVLAGVSERIVEFGVAQVPYHPISHPAVARALRDAYSHSYEDLQVTPDGRYALFSTVVPLTGYASRGHSEIFRYDSDGGELACPSCAPSGAVGGSDVTLSSSGLGLTDDGRVFFSTLESFALRDTNEKRDVYEWDRGHAGLLSTGIGQFDSSLDTVSADGTDAFFFTRDTLSSLDQNGNAVKVYDARVGGGFLQDQPIPPCAASDECHGAGSPMPGVPDINTVTGSEKPSQPSTTANTKKCKKGTVKKHGKCVKKKPKKHRKHRRTHR